MNLGNSVLSGPSCVSPGHCHCSSNEGSSGGNATSELLVPSSAALAPGDRPPPNERGLVTYNADLNLPLNGPTLRTGEVWQLGTEDGRSMQRAYLALHANGLSVRPLDGKVAFHLAWSPFSLVQACRLHTVQADNATPWLRLFKVSVFHHGSTHIFATYGEKADSDRAQWLADVSRALRMLTQSLFPSYSIRSAPLPGAGWTNTRLLAGYLLLCDDRGVSLVYCELHSHFDGTAMFAGYEDEHCDCLVMRMNIELASCVTERVGVDCSCFSLVGRHFAARTCAEKMLWLRAISNVKVKLRHCVSNPTPEELKSYRLAIQESARRVEHPAEDFTRRALLPRRSPARRGPPTSQQPAGPSTGPSGAAFVAAGAGGSGTNSTGAGISVGSAGIATWGTTGPPSTQPPQEQASSRAGNSPLGPPDLARLQRLPPPHRPPLLDDAPTHYGNSNGRSSFLSGASGAVNGGHVPLSSRDAPASEPVMIRTLAKMAPSAPAAMDSPVHIPLRDPPPLPPPIEGSDSQQVLTPHTGRGVADEEPEVEDQADNRMYMTSQGLSSSMESSDDREETTWSSPREPSDRGLGGMQQATDPMDEAIASAMRVAGNQATVLELEEPTAEGTGGNGSSQPNGHEDGYHPLFAQTSLAVNKGREKFTAGAIPEDAAPSPEPEAEASTLSDVASMPLPGYTYQDSGKNSTAPRRAVDAPRPGGAAPPEGVPAIPAQRHAEGPRVEERCLTVQRRRSRFGGLRCLAGVCGGGRKIASPQAPQAPQALQPEVPSLRVPGAAESPRRTVLGPGAALTMASGLPQSSQQELWVTALPQPPKPHQGDDSQEQYPRHPAGLQSYTSCTLEDRVTI